MVTDAANAQIPTLAASATTMCVVIAAAVRTLMKEHRERRDTRKKPSDSATLKSIETNVGQLSTRFEEFTREQRTTNEMLLTRIEDGEAAQEATTKDLTEVDHIVRGVDKENGMRSQFRAIEKRVAQLERGPVQVGTFTPHAGQPR